MTADNCQWAKWLADFRRQLTVAKGWSEKDAKRCLRDTWVVVRDGQVYALGTDQRPADAIPIFEILTPGGWKRPIEITDRLTDLIAKAMTSQRSPRDIVLALLDLTNHAGSPNESDEIKQKRDKAAFWIAQLLDACEDKALAGVVGGDVFWQALLYALEAGNRLAVLGLHSDSQVFADLVKAQAFQSGRGPDELSRCLEASFIERQAALGRDPTPQEVFEAAGGVESKIDECWEFNDINGAPSVKVEALYRRLDRIRQRHS